MLNEPGRTLAMGRPSLMVVPQPHWSDDDPAYRPGGDGYFYGSGLGLDPRSVLDGVSGIEQCSCYGRLDFYPDVPFDHSLEHRDSKGVDERKQCHGEHGF